MDYNLFITFFFQFWFFNMDIHKATIDNCLENVKEVK